MNLSRFVCFTFVLALAIAGCKTRQSGSGLAGAGGTSACEELKKCDGPTCLVKKEEFFRGLKGDANFSLAAVVTDYAMLKGVSIAEAQSALGITEKDGAFSLKEGVTDAQVWDKATEARVSHATANPKEYTAELAKTVAESLTEARQSLNGDTPAEKEAAATRARGLASTADSLAKAFAAVGKSNLGLPLREVGFQIMADADLLGKPLGLGHPEFVVMRDGAIAEIREANGNQSKNLSDATALPDAKIGVASAMARASLASAQANQTKSAQEIMKDMNSIFGAKGAALATDRALAIDALVAAGGKAAGIPTVALDSAKLLPKLQSIGVKGTSVNAADLGKFADTVKLLKPEMIDAFSFEKASTVYAEVVRRKIGEIPPEFLPAFEGKGGEKSFTESGKREYKARLSGPRVAL